MKEIIYIQAGNFANHIGTHFWNTQESYFTYEEGEDPIVEHDISFREGRTLNGESTFCPRLLLFDHKSNFGVLDDGLYGDEAAEIELEGITSEWNGSIVEYRQDALPKSEYQAHLEEEFGGEGSSSHFRDSIDESSSYRPATSSVRYWSDYSRVALHPRTTQRIPNVPEYENHDGDWVLGRDTFKRYDEEISLMEGSFRVFVEECDSLQGLQVMNDTTSFGGFTHSLITSFRDEFTKTSCFTFPILSSSVPGLIEADDAIGIRKALNDALFLRSLDELSTICIPFQSPVNWQRGRWSRNFNHFSRRNLYQTSALLSTHLESTTLPVRLRDTTDDLSSIASILNWREVTRFAHIGGVFPLTSTSPFDAGGELERRLYDHTMSSTPDPHIINSALARVDVLRGLSSFQQSSYEEYLDGLRLIIPHNVRAPSIPLPTSFPPLLLQEPSSPVPDRQIANIPLTSVSAVSMLFTTPSTSNMFSLYADFVETVLHKNGDVTERMGLDRDDIRILMNDLRILEDTYKEGNDAGSGVAYSSFGEDEEF
ncbi:hypothetical protein NLI96_g11147 [Meripilus lineatus]|uniref:Tubulin nucleotide-binding domain-like protein n=1 Tax=Meripilus lineatus TaxID=2056292 RepID=A0AAD5UWJ2_9APHY|nr:hypothetical protein NLI96_g11147 [Physisporinus lineatus]